MGFWRNYDVTDEEYKTFLEFVNEYKKHRRKTKLRKHINKLRRIIRKEDR